jgi:predicted RNase H-like HicB family nuclease
MSEAVELHLENVAAEAIELHLENLAAHRLPISDDNETVPVFTTIIHVTPSHV